MLLTQYRNPLSLQNNSGCVSFSMGAWSQTFIAAFCNTDQFGGLPIHTGRQETQSLINLGRSVSLADCGWLAMGNLKFFKPSWSILLGGFAARGGLFKMD